MTFFVYILYSSDFDKHYIGQTQDLISRLKQHNSGYLKSTSPYIPWEMVWNCEKSDRGDALILEKKLKNLSKKRLLIFIEKYS